MSQPKLNTTRLALTKIREGDYLHAGEEEAIDLVLKKVLEIDPDLASKATLDVGSGLGGTANYFYNQGFKDVQGIDKDTASIAFTKEKYPFIKFTEKNAFELDTLYPASTFSLIYMFNVIYAIEDKATLVNKLAAVAKPGCVLVLFDYSEGKGDIPIIDAENNPVYTIQIEEIKKDLDKAGWEVVDINDLTEKFIGWYQEFVRKINKPSSAVQNEFSHSDLVEVNKIYSYLLELLEKGDMGGVVIYAIRK